MFRWTIEGQFYLSIVQEPTNEGFIFPSIVQSCLHQKKFIFFNYFRKVTVVADIFCRNLFPTCSVSAPALWMKPLNFLAKWKTDFLPKWRHTNVQLISKDAMLLSETDDMFTDSLAQSGRELWPIIISKARIVAPAGVKDI